MLLHVVFSKINSYEISFLFKVRKLISGFYVYGEIILQSIHDFQRDFTRNVQHSVGMLKVTKRNSNVHLKFANSGHTWHRFTVKLDSVFLQL